MTQTRLRDFSRVPRPLEFDADGDHFVCHPHVPPETLQDMLNLVPEMQEDFGRIGDFFTLAMPGPSATLMNLRLNSVTNPITLMQALDIATWLIEAHSQRPTLPSASSTSGLQTEPTGIDSTDGAPQAA